MAGTQVNNSPGDNTAEILQLRAEVRVLEKGMRQIQTRLDDAYARKIKIMAETLRLRSAMRMGRDAINWCSPRSLARARAHTHKASSGVDSVCGFCTCAISV